MTDKHRPVDPKRISREDTPETTLAGQAASEAADRLSGTPQTSGMKAANRWPHRN